MTRTPWTPAAAALVACLALAAPAHAQMTVTQDAADNGAKDADTKKVTVHHGKKRVRIKTRMHAGSHLPHEMWHLVDTRGGRRPEFLVFAVVHNEVDPEPSVGVYEVDAWPRRKNPYRVLHDGTEVDCGLHQGDKADGAKLLKVVTGRGCYRTDGTMPKRLRVNTFGTWEWGKVTDSVPRWRRYGPWTRAG